ncbi:MAG TPA: response regulator transcription factor [Desertimonas sp.]|nr:response regulator transcription factor [Desertimonas sp.]
MPGPIRVGVVDDHPSILAAVTAAIDDADDLVLGGTGRTLNDALLLLPQVDVLLCDVQLEGQAEGIRVLEVAHEQGRSAPVLLLSGHGHPSVVRAAVDRGAAGYLDKSTEVGAILDAVRTVAAGGTVFRAADLAAARATPRRPSERELQVISAVADGRTNAEVATELGVSEKTVETHLHRLFDRYGLMSRTELAVLAVEERWVRGSGGGPA